MDYEIKKINNEIRKVPADNKIIKVDPAEFGLEEKQAENISAMFTPMLNKMVELENDYNALIKLEISDEKIKAAKALLKEYKQTRIATAEIHKGAKAYFLRGGRFVDSWKNAQLLAAGEKEKTLKDIANYYEIQRKLKIEKLQAEREKMASPYIENENSLPGNLGQMTVEVWENYLTGLKARAKEREQARIAAEKEAKEQARIEKLQKERLAAIAPVAAFVDNWDDLKNNLGILTDKKFYALWAQAKKRKHADDEKREVLRKENEKLHLAAIKKKEAEEREIKKKLAAKKKKQELFEKRLSEIPARLSQYVTSSQSEIADMTKTQWTNYKKRITKEYNDRMEADRILKERQEKEAKEKERLHLMKTQDDDANLNDFKNEIIDFRKTSRREFKTQEAINLMERIDHHFDVILSTIGGYLK